MKVLNLVLKSRWFDMIERGEKKEEYRDITAYWEKRITKEHNYTHVRFVRGYRAEAPRLLFKIKKISCRDGGRAEWGADPGRLYFVIELGAQVILPVDPSEDATGELPEFEPCDNCDLPDACADFGCAVKIGRVVAEGYPPTASKKGGEK